MSSPVEHAAARTIGTVESVAPGEVRVVMDLDAPQAVALNAGQPQRFPRINGFVLIPNEVGSLVGLVSWLGVERSPYPKRTGLKDFGLIDLPFPLRKLSLVPLGTLLAEPGAEQSGYRLERGVISFPSVGDPVLLPSREQLKALVEARDEDRRVVIGSSPIGADAPVSVDPDKLFGRHLAVLGNTGSGKSCSVAGLIRWSLDAARSQREEDGQEGPPNARFLILDPNGEYRSTFSDQEDVRIFQVVPDQNAQPLRVPAWIWNSHEWAAFAQAAPGAQRPLLMRTLRNLRAGAALESGPEVALARLVRGYNGLLAEKLIQGPSSYAGDFGSRKAIGVLLERFTADLERYVGSCADVEEQLATLIADTGAAASAQRFEFADGDAFGFNAFDEGTLAGICDCAGALLQLLPEMTAVGGPSEDAPLPFDPNEMPGHMEALTASEEFSQSAAFVSTLMLRVRSMLADVRLAPIIAPEQEIEFEQWLTDYVGAPEAAAGQIAVLDLSMVPSDVVHLVVAVVARVVFEALQRYRKLYEKELPTVLVLEEAHTFVQRQLGEDPDHATPARMCRETFERIAREGRKFGLGLVLSSQRPYELSQTVLAQCNTFLLHRLVNDRDQDLVRHLVPDNLGGLLSELPSLPSQQAILLGWATPVPVLVRMKHLPVAQRPKSADPSYWEVWTGQAERELDWGRIAKDWIT